MKKKLEETNAKYKIAVDKHRRHKVFQDGDMEQREISNWYLQQAEAKEICSIMNKFNDNAYVLIFLVIWQF